MEWALKRRWTQDGDLGRPMLRCLATPESPIACETRTGQVVVGDATLTCGKEAGWLFASPATRRWVAAYHGLRPAPLTLIVPGGRVDIEATGTGTVVWDNGQVAVEAVDLRGEPIINPVYSK